jgi:hypothetical protein
MIAARLERETATSEPGAMQGASSSLSSKRSSGNDSKVLGNEFAVTTDNHPLSDSKKNESADTSQFTQFIPLAPQMT